MIYKNSIAADALLDLSETSVSIAAGPMSVVSDKDGGNFIQGPLSISSPFTSIRMGGIYKFNQMNMLGMPSTMVTPIPLFQIEPPIKEVGSLLAISSMVLSAVT